MTGRAMELKAFLNPLVAGASPCSRAGHQQGLDSHGFDLAGAPLRKRCLERGEGSGVIPVLGGRQLQLCHQPPRVVAHCDRAQPPSFLRSGMRRAATGRGPLGGVGDRYWSQ